MKFVKPAILAVLAVLMLLPLMVFDTGASSAYQTYTFSIEGDALYSPDAYSAVKSVSYTDMGLDKEFNNVNDLVTDKDENVYIADTGNNRIVVLNRYYEYEFSITAFQNGQGNNDELAAPRGVFVTDDDIWVCDTDKNRIVKFDKKGNFKRIYDAPESQLFDDNAIYKPIAMAIDQYGRIYVVSSSTYQGIIVMDSEGNFIGFIGAQAVTISAWDILWRRFQTEEQRRLAESYVSTEYNNITISDEGFVYVTTSSIDESSARGAVTKGNKDGKYMPVKLLNPAGDEIMRRNGFWPPVGEVNFSTISKATYSGTSTITDVAVGPEKTWTIIDSKRQKIYTYDYNGNLLFAFGDKGTMLGSIANIRAVAYQGTTMLVLDDGSHSVIVYERTEYGDLLLEAIRAENDLDFSYAISCWENVLQRNGNFDAAYVGIGNALYRAQKYKQSLEYYETAYETDGWSSSYMQVRKLWMKSWFGLVVLGIIAAIVLIVLFFGWAGRVNKRVATNGQEHKTFGQEIIYGFHVIFHPFDGFYDLKHEHRGSVRAALVFLVAAIIAFFYQGIGKGYVLNPTRDTSSIGTQIISVLVPFLLFVLGNWCLTTLFEGEGSFKDIFIATAYSLIPIVLLVIPATLFSNWVTTSEAGIISLLTTIAFIWVGILIYFGTMVTHDYSIVKNLITIVGTILAMACIVFIVLLFSMLLSKLVGLITNIVTEIQYRV